MNSLIAEIDSCSILGTAIVKVAAKEATDLLVVLKPQSIVGHPPLRGPKHLRPLHIFSEIGNKTKRYD